MCCLHNNYYNIILYELYFPHKFIFYSQGKWHPTRLIALKAISGVQQLFKFTNTVISVHFTYQTKWKLKIVVVVVVIVVVIVVVAVVVVTQWHWNIFFE